MGCCACIQNVFSIECLLYTIERKYAGDELLLIPQCEETETVKKIKLKKNTAGDRLLLIPACEEKETVLKIK
jgi:hypothetical protein